MNQSIAAMANDNTNTDGDTKPVSDKSGHVYKSQSEKMMYYMRRKRNSPLPHFPPHKHAQER